MNNIDNHLSNYSKPTMEALRNFGVDISRKEVDEFALKHFGRLPKSQSERTRTMETKIMCELKAENESTYEKQK